MTKQCSFMYPLSAREKSGHGIDGFSSPSALGLNHGVAKTALMFVDTYSLLRSLRLSEELIFHGYVRSWFSYWFCSKVVASY